MTKRRKAVNNSFDFGYLWVDMIRNFLSKVFYYIFSSCVRKCHYCLLQRIRVKSSLDFVFDKRPGGRPSGPPPYGKIDFFNNISRT